MQKVKDGCRKTLCQRSQRKTGKFVGGGGEMVCLAFKQTKNECKSSKISAKYIVSKPSEEEREVCGGLWGLRLFHGAFKQAKNCPTFQPSSGECVKLPSCNNCCILL